ncbi:hypothetical protein F5878DRAFT_654680 [Lentinula raphanica]|uniref:Retrotransposon gag domain-containing protein n=1 Tax=Lentinula raphanica TaxID=153919 RepID=A0AA38NX34_9AGAR|nr:hypothetical protein F5878DRAFT_654680 [Lentinula raphanica]
MTTVTDIASNMGTSKSISKPQPYDGKRSDDARRFMAAFELWFWGGDAAIWATPISENISNVNNNVAGASFIYPTWNLFKEAFKARFETVNPVVDAKEALKGLWQGKNTHASYLRDRFYQHLSNRVKDGLVTLDGLIQEAMHIDNRQIKRAKERGQIPNSTSAFHAIPFAPAHATSTGRSPDDYQKFMAGRCYGYGHHERDVCDYSNVCRRNQRTAATAGSSTSSIAATTAPTNQKTLADQISELRQNF